MGSEELLHLEYLNAGLDDEINELAILEYYQWYINEIENKELETENKIEDGHKSGDTFSRGTEQQELPF